MDRVIFHDESYGLKLYIHDDGKVEFYLVRENPRYNVRFFLNVDELSEALARARSFLAGVIKT